MSTLSSILLSTPEADGLVNELAATLEAHIAGKTGLAGMAMKLGFGTLKAARPDVASRAARMLLPDIARALEPLYADFRQTGSADFGQFLLANRVRATRLVSAAVDQRMASVRNTTARSIYQRFSGSIDAELDKLLPACGRVLTRHLG